MQYIFVFEEIFYGETNRFVSAILMKKRLSQNKLDSFFFFMFIRYV